MRGVCDNCRFVGYLKAGGLCRLCYNYRQRTGRGRPASLFDYDPMECVAVEIRIERAKRKVRDMGLGRGR